MLPHMHHNPVKLRELSVFLAVTFHIACKLLLPPVAIVFRKDTVAWAGMPEASINKHRDTCAGKCDVGAARESSIIYSKPQSAVVQFSAYQYFGPRGISWHPLHLS